LLAAAAVVALLGVGVAVPVAIALLFPARCLVVARWLKPR
jgi:hypothetical protein